MPSTSLSRPLVPVFLLVAGLAARADAADRPASAPPAAATPAPKAAPGTIAASFLSPSERVEEPLVVTLTPAVPEGPGS